MGEAKGIDIATSSVDEIVEACMDDNDLIVTVVDATAGADRRLRQKSAEVIATIASRDAALIAPYSAEMADALSRPEARTRWQILDAFRYLVATDSRATDKALTGAETALYDEQSGPARLAAFRFIATYGATTETRAEKVWPLIDEALQCYHGDPEFDDMLIATLTFAQGKIGHTVKAELAERMSFDASNSRGPVGRRAKAIVDACK